MVVVAATRKENNDFLKVVESYEQCADDDIQPMGHTFTYCCYVGEALLFMLWAGGVTVPSSAWNWDSPNISGSLGSILRILQPSWT